MVGYFLNGNQSQSIIKVPNNSCKSERASKSKYSRIIHDFLGNTTFHGLRYIGDKSIKNGSRFIWLSIFISSLGFCLFLSEVTWMRYEKTPTIILVDTINFPTRLVKFPAVTICYINKFLEQVIAPVKDELLELGFGPDNIYEFFESYYASNIRFGSAELADVEIINALIAIGFDFESVLEAVNPCKQLLVNCMWRNKRYDCHKMFEARLSFQGHCCRFNIDFFRNNTVGENVTYNTGASCKTGLEVEVNMTTPLDLPSTITTGAKIFIHDGRRELTVYDSSILLAENISMDLSLIPFFVVSTNDLQSISKKNRKCFLTGVDKMERLPNYSHEMCLDHVFHNMIYETCGCIPFYLKNTDSACGWNNIAHCKITEAKCFRDIVASIRSNTSTVGNRSECLFACDVIHFTINSDIMENSNVRTFLTSSVAIYYDDRHCIKYTRGVLFSWNQLFAALGGIFGLCLGASMINILELIFLAVNILRTVIIKRNNKPRRWRMKNKHRVNQIDCNNTI